MSAAMKREAVGTAAAALLGLGIVCMLGELFALGIALMTAGVGAVIVYERMRG